VQLLGVHFNHLSSKEARNVKNGFLFPLNDDRKVVQKLFSVLGPKFKDRAGGYTRIVKINRRLGDGALLAKLQILKIEKSKLKLKEKQKPKATNTKKKNVAKKIAKK
jgi:hypothetical protein